jgi:hypothetical protein
MEWLDNLFGRDLLTFSWLDLDGNHRPPNHFDFPNRRKKQTGTDRHLRSSLLQIKFQRGRQS